MQYIGITERGDAGLDFSWADKLYDANIIITKNPNDKFIEHALKHKDKIILHITCTGFGGSVIEPNVPLPYVVINQTYKLIQLGFPKKQIVLRLDPIIPTNKGLMKTKEILNLFANIGIKRCRYSFLDIYPHVKQRFADIGMNLPYDTFTAPKEMIDNAMDLLSEYEDIYEFESCAENTKHKLGCISQKDLGILGVSMDTSNGGFQRNTCMCLGNKKELLKSKKRCSHKCLYCYWKD